MTKVEAVVTRERVETVIDAVEAETGHDIPVPGGYGTESHNHLVGRSLPQPKEPVTQPVAEEQAA